MQTIASAVRCIGVVWAIVDFGAPLTFFPSISNLSPLSPTIFLRF